MSKKNELKTSCDILTFFKYFIFRKSVVHNLVFIIEWKHEICNSKWREISVESGAAVACISGKESIVVEEAVSA